MGYLVLLSYLSSQLFFKIKPFVGLSYVLLNYSELSSFPKFFAYPLGMRGIPVLEKYLYILYFKWYDIIILLNSVFHTLQLRNTPVGGSASQIAVQPVKCDNRTTRWIKQIKLYQRIRN